MLFDVPLVLGLGAADGVSCRPTWQIKIYALPLGGCAAKVVDDAALCEDARWLC